MVALCLSFAIPALVRRLTRRWTYTLGALLIGACAVLITQGQGWSIALALLARTSGSAILNITLNLYIMDNIGKKDLVRSEPLRLGTATLAWSASPFVGVLAVRALRDLGDQPDEPRGRRLPRRGLLGAAAAGGRADPAGARAGAQPARLGAALRVAAAAAARLGDRLRAVGVLGDLLHLRADPDDRGRARRDGGRARGGGGQPDAAQQPLRAGRDPAAVAAPHARRRLSRRRRPRRRDRGLGRRAARSRPARRWWRPPSSSR
jgi:hypothetical protein